VATEMEVVARIAGDASGAVNAFNQATGAAQQFQGQMDKMNAALVAVGAAIGGIGIAAIKFGKQAFEESARVRELDVAMNAIGRSTGVGAKALRDAAAAIKAKGIETAAAQKMAIEYAQGELDLAQAADVARVAQDLAVISQKNSTDTAMLLTRAIKTGNSMLLKSAGVSRQASEGYAMYAEQLGKSQTELTAMERQQAMINLILDEGTKVAGVYEAAMMEAGKVLRSFPRIFNDMQVAIGSALTEGLGPLILATYKMVTSFSKAIAEGGALYPIVEALTMVMKEMFEPLTLIVNGITNFIKGLEIGADAAPQLAAAIQAILPLVSALAAGLTALAGKSLLGNLPVIGRFAMMLNPIAIGLTTLIVLTPQLRDKFLELFGQLRKLLPPLLAIAYAVAQAGSEFLNEFIVPVAEVMINLLKPAIEGVSAVFGLFTSSTHTARNAIEILKVAMIVLTAVFVAQKIVALASYAVTKAQAIWSGILTVATFLLILATNGLTAAMAALGVAITATGIGAIIVVIGLIIAALIAWYTKSVWFRNAIKQILEAIVNFFIIMLNAVIIVINKVLKVSADVVNAFIGIYNKIASITGLPKIEPITPLQIGLVKTINIALEKTSSLLTINYAKMRAIERAQKKENQGRADAIGWLEAYNKKVKEEIEGQKGSGAGADEKAKKITELKNRTLEYVKDALGRATDALKREKDAMEDYARSVSSAITENLSFSGALQTVTEHNAKQTEEINRQTAAFNTYADSVASAISKILSLSGVLQSQKAAADEVAKSAAEATKASMGLTTAQEKHAEQVAAAQERVQSALEDVAEIAQDERATEKQRLAAVTKYLDAVKTFTKVRDDTRDIAAAQSDLAAATERSNKAQAAQMSFLDRLAEQAKQATGFAQRITKLAEAGLSKQALDQIVGAGAEAGTTIADELLAGGATAVARANQLFSDLQKVAETTGAATASKFMKIGTAVGMDLISSFNKQAEEATLFADRVRQLTEAGLSKESLALVLKAGVKAGTEIADYLLVAGSDRILKANNIVIGLQTVGESLGLLLGETFFQAGVTLADQIVKGLESQVKEVEKALNKLKDLKEVRAYLQEIKTRTDATTAPLKGIAPKTITGNPKAAPLPVLPVDGSLDALSGIFGDGKIIPLAEGGIVKRPVLAMVGEAGPEAVIPLSSGLNSVGSNQSIVLNVNAGMGTDGNQVGDQIVEALTRWQKRNGSLPLSVS